MEHPTNQVDSIDREIDILTDGSGRILREDISWVVRWTSRKPGYTDRYSAAMFADLAAAAEFAIELEGTAQV